MKRKTSLIAIILAFLIAFSSVSFGSISVNADAPGDANKDGYINAQDVLWVRKYLAKISEPRKIRPGDPADVNSTDALDTDDIFQLRRYIAKLQKEFYVRGYTTVPTTKATTATTTHGNDQAPFYEGGVPRYYFNQLAQRAVAFDNPYYTVAVNQAGYSTNAKKIVKLVEGFERTPQLSLIENRDIYLVDEATRQVVATFKSGKKYLCTPGKLNGTDDAWQSSVDISSFTTPGTYRLYAPAGYSYPFTISDNPYARVMDYMLMALYYQRCGGAVEKSVLQKYADYLEEQYGESAADYMKKYGAHARTACHYESTGSNKGREVVIVDQWDGSKFTANTDEKGNVIRLPASQFAYGLHDAGDYGRYTQPASQVVADLCQAYQMYPEVFQTDIIQDTNSKGEKDNLPDILDQLRWEAKFLLNMQNLNKDSSSYGGFYFKICTETFASAQGAKPETDGSFNGTRGDYKGLGGFRVMSVNFATSAGAAGALANTAIIFKDIDPDFAKQCQDAAELCYDWYTNNRKSSPRDMTEAEKNARDKVPTSTVASGWGTGGGAYGGTASEANSSQFYMWAALYRLTKNSKYAAKISSSTVDYTMGSQAHGGYGALQYVLMNKYNEGTTDQSLVDTIINKWKSSAIANNTTTSKSSFGDLAQYGWGSMGQEGSIKANGLAAYFVNDGTDYVLGARSLLNFKLGTNWLGYCFVTGLSEGSSKNIHHYPSVVLKRENKDTQCTPGQMAAGYSQGQGSDTSFHYSDKDGDYVSNEICVYWNSSCLAAYATVVQQDMDTSGIAEASSID